MTQERVSRQSFLATGARLGATAVAGTALLRGQVASAATTQITFGFSGGTFIEKYFSQDLSTLSHDVPGISAKQVIYATYDDLLNAMPSQVAAKTNPDVLYWTNEQAPEYIANGVLAPLDDLLKGTTIHLADFYPALVQGWRQNGKLYAIPFNGQNSALVVNRGLLARAGITSMPRSMADVRAAAKTVKAKTGKTGLVILDNLFHISQYVYAFGGSWGNGKTINSANNVRGLQFLVDLFVTDKSAATAKQLGASWDGEAFAKNEVAFSTGGPWYIGYMATSGPSVNYQLMPIPASVPGKTVMVTYGGGLSIFADVDQKAAAMKLVEYLVRDQSMNLMVKGSLQYLPAKTKYMNEYISAVPKFTPLRSGFFHGMPLGYPPKVNEFGAALTQGFEQLIFHPGQGTVKQLLDTLQQQFGA